MEGRTIVVAGADVVDGSPVLDVKPYLPFCDSVPDAVAPSWVRDRLSLRFSCLGRHLPLLMLHLASGAYRVTLHMS